MASLQSKIGIWNATLDILRQNPLSSVTDVRAEANWLSRNYDQQRDYLLERLNWKFALTRANLPADAVAPAWDWAHRYLLPSDCLKLIPPTMDGAWMSTPIAYELESGHILTSHSAPLRVRYVRRVTNEGEFSNGFCEVLALRLAMRMAHWLTGKQSMVDEIRVILQGAISEVRSTEAFQIAGGVYYDDNIAIAREAAY